MNRKNKTKLRIKYKFIDNEEKASRALKELYEKCEEVLVYHTKWTCPGCDREYPHNVMLLRREIRKGDIYVVKYLYVEVWDHDGVNTLLIIKVPEKLLDSVYTVFELMDKMLGIAEKVLERVAPGLLYC